MEATFVLVCQVILAVIFIWAGIVKLSKSKEDLLKKVSWAEDYNQQTIKLFGWLELLGGLGVILPLVFGSYLWVVPMSCMGLAMVMAGAMVVHLRREELSLAMLNIFLLFMSAGVSFYRLLELDLNWL
ncbi:MAG: DoxX family protein [Flavobacteriales bacterium]|nr:DoxX family protein [Flavobacteriales bacterium]